MKLTPEQKRVNAAARMLKRLQAKAYAARKMYEGQVDHYLNAARDGSDYAAAVVAKHNLT